MLSGYELGRAVGAQIVKAVLIAACLGFLLCALLIGTYAILSGKLPATSTTTPAKMVKSE